jgi:folate-binding protein YgfZ
MPNSDSSHKQPAWNLIMEVLNYLKVARFDGPEAEGFLQAQLTADIGALKPGDASYACYCSPRGQVFGLLLIFRDEEGFQVIGAGELLAGILERLRMFVFRTRVEFSMEDALFVYGLQPDECNSIDRAFRPAGSNLGYLVAEAGLPVAEKESFKATEIINQVSWLGAATTEKFIPQMLGFEQIGAVSFTKGCFPGQEIVARTRYLGKVKRKPDIISVEQALDFDVAEKVELRRADQWLNGTVVDYAIDSTGSTHLFIIAPGQPEGTTLELRYRDQSYLCATT